jgi:hypothetical protein
MLLSFMPILLWTNLRVLAMDQWMKDRKSRMSLRWPENNRDIFTQYFRFVESLSLEHSFHFKQLRRLSAVWVQLTRGAAMKIYSVFFILFLDLDTLMWLPFLRHWSDMYVTYLRLLICLCMSGSMRTYINTHIHTYVHTYIHTYIYTCIIKFGEESVTSLIWWKMLLFNIIFISRISKTVHFIIHEVY